MLTAKDLLYKALDYDGFWNTSKRMRDSTPSKSRKLQLENLLKGFDISKSNAKANIQVIGNQQIETVYFTSKHLSPKSRIEYIKTLSSFNYFNRGEFITDASIEKYRDLINDIISTAKSIFPEQAEIIDTQGVDLKQLFCDLYNFRLSVYHMSTFRFSNRRMKSFSVEDDYTSHLQKKFFELTNQNLSEIDEILGLIIDPEKRSLKEAEIDYPDFNLEIIDREWENEYFSQNIPTNPGL